MVGLGGINEPSRLNTVDSLTQGAMEKCILHIELVNRPGARQCQSEDNPDGSWFDNRTESLIIINARSLSETAKHPPCFIAVKRAIRLELMTKNPLAGDKVDAGRARHQGLGVVCLQGVELGLHSKTPGQIQKSGMDG